MLKVPDTVRLRWGTRSRTKKKSFYFYGHQEWSITTFLTLLPTSRGPHLIHESVYINDNKKGSNMFV